MDLGSPGSWLPVSPRGRSSAGTRVFRLQSTPTTEGNTVHTFDHSLQCFLCYSLAFHFPNFLWKLSIVSLLQSTALILRKQNTPQTRQCLTLAEFMWKTKIPSNRILRSCDVKTCQPTLPHLLPLVFRYPRDRRSVVRPSVVNNRVHAHTYTSAPKQTEPSHSHHRPQTHVCVCVCERETEKFSNMAPAV